MNLMECSPKIRRDIVVRTESEGCLLYNPATDQLHLVSEEAVAFLRKFDGTRCVEDVIQELATAPNKEEAESTKWLNLLLVADLMDRKLLEV